jgi:hypothetical protein
MQQLGPEFENSETPDWFNNFAPLNIYGYSYLCLSCQPSSWSMDSEMSRPSISHQGYSEQLLQPSIEWGLSPRKIYRTSTDQPHRTQYSNQESTGDMICSQPNRSHSMQFSNTAPVDFQMRTDISRTYMCQRIHVGETINQSTPIFDQGKDPMRTGPR